VAAEALKTRIEDLELSSRTISALEKPTFAPWAAWPQREDDLLEVEALVPKRYRKLSARSAALASFLNK